MKKKRTLKRAAGKVLTAMLAVAMVPAFCSFSSNAAGPAKTEKDGCVFSCYDDNNDGIPESIILTSLTDKGKSVKEVILPSSVTYNGKECPPKGGELILQDAFKNDTVLRRIAVPGIYKSVAGNAEAGVFSGCTSLKELAFAEGFGSEYIGQNSLAGCQKAEMYWWGGKDLPTDKNFMDMLRQSGLFKDKADGTVYPGITLTTVKGSAIDKYAQELNAGIANEGDRIMIRYSENPYGSHDIEAYNADSNTDGDTGSGSGGNPDHDPDADWNDPEITPAAPGNDPSVTPGGGTGKENGKDTAADSGKPADKDTGKDQGKDTGKENGAGTKPAAEEKPAAEPRPAAETKPADQPAAKPETTVKPSPAPVAESGKAKDGTALGAGASESFAESFLTGYSSEADPAGSVFRVLQAKAKKVTKKSIKLTWKKPAGAVKFVVYGNKCGKKNKYVKQTETKGTSVNIKKVNGKALKKKTYYKFIVVAVDKDGKVVASSKTVHAATKGGKAGNAKALATKAKKNKVTVKAGKKFKLKAKAKAPKKVKVKKHRAILFESSDPSVATVSKKGVITGVKAGKCSVYVYAQNGICKKIAVTVK